ncbi:MAG TPA: cardiolipin synthase [Humisphaera sp.]
MFRPLARPRLRRRPGFLALSIVLILVPLAAGCSNLDPGYPYKIESKYGVADPQFSRTMGHLLGPPLVHGNDIRSFRNGDRIFPAMLADIAAAQRSVTFETFIYWKGEVGKKFTDALCDRARAGVKVHLLIDAVGSDKMDEDYLKRMRACGCKIEIYNPLRWFDLTSAARLNNRTHRKLLVVDGKVGYTGGVGIADEWLGDAQDPGHWRDTQYRLTGPAVADLQSAFMDHWMESSGYVLHGDDYFPQLDRAGDKYAQVFKSGPGGGGESMQLMYLLSFAAARKSLRLSTAYFVPDDLTIRTLVEARKRGVRVQVIVPNHLTDVPLTRHASRAVWGDLLEAGVEIYEYQPTMYHNKLMVVDDLWVSVGSTNLDNRGFRLNGEANVNVLDPAFGAEAAAQFDADLTRASRITYEQWADRPFGERFAEVFASLLKWQL